MADNRTSTDSGYIDLAGVRALRPILDEALRVASNVLKPLSRLAIGVCQPEGDGRVREKGQLGWTTG